MMQGENLQIEVEIIVIVLEAVVPILIGRDQIGIDLKNLLEPKFLKKSFHGKAVELTWLDTSAKELIPKLWEKLSMLKFVLV